MKVWSFRTSTFRGLSALGLEGRYSGRVPDGYWLETLGCAKNQVDSDKLAGLLESEGYAAVDDPENADLVVVNTCAFIEAARQESIDTVLSLAQARRPGARLVVTGCMAQRYGDDLAEAIPEADLVAGFGVPVTLSSKKKAVPSFDLLNLPRPPSSSPWAYVKIAEGCDRRCGFCAIPSFRGRQRSRSLQEIVAETEALSAKEIVLVAQDLASWGRDVVREGRENPPFTELVRAVAEAVDRVRLLYLYPSELTEALIQTIAETGCSYFDLSLQHVSAAHLRRMRRWGNGDRFLAQIDKIRALAPDAALRSSFIIGYPGETEEDQDELLAFLQEAQLDWAGFFSYSQEEGTYAADRPDQVDSEIVRERLVECSQMQDRITSVKRASLVGTNYTVLVDAPGVARGHREAPEIDGIVKVPRGLEVGAWYEVEIVGSTGPDLEAVPLRSVSPAPTASRFLSQ